MAGLLMHEALTMDVEAGVPPMTAIQAATINVAKTFHKDKDYGSVEPGKVADLSIIEGDPLQGHLDDAERQAGGARRQDRRSGSSPATSIRSPSSIRGSSLSVHIEVTPLSITQGTGPTTLKVRGKGFWPFHQVLLNGKELETKFVSRSELQAIVPAEAVKDVGMYKVTVKSRGETIAESNPAPLVVKFK